MNRVAYDTDPALAPFVQDCFEFSGYCPEHSKERVIPDGSAYLIFALDGFPRRVYDNATLQPESTVSGAWLSGVHRDYITIEALDNSSLAVVRFRAGGARAILGALMERSIGRVLPIDELQDIGVGKLFDRIAGCQSSLERWRSIRDWLLDRLAAEGSQSAAVAAAVRRIEEDPLFLSGGLSELVAESGYSQKQFTHLFKRYVGLTPKAFQRIQRFHEILPLVLERQTLSWADISYECGYYDQSHFIREFKRFSGHSPEAYLREGGRRTNFLPVLER